MNEERLRQRLAELEAQRDLLLAQLNAAGGAIAECRRWLAEMAKESA
ncbi:MAG: hypothetical protein M0Z94_08355 [Dehalococcoidales bacterium]|nr:hypothetical protein [Dehalococcoidales bacterium]